MADELHVTKGPMKCRNYGSKGIVVIRPERILHEDVVTLTVDLLSRQ